MSKRRYFVQFVLGVILVGVAVNLVSDYLGSHYGKAEKPLLIVLIVGVVIWIGVIATDIAYTRLIAGRYAVEAFILNERDELLLYRHPFHKCMIPPGGRVGRTEFPNEALEARLKERLGLTPQQYKFDDRIHQDLNPSSTNIGNIQRMQIPFMVQREIHKQRTFVKYHYDFIYVLKLLPGQAFTALPKYEPVHFVSLSGLQEMVSQGTAFPDVLDAYQRILKGVRRIRRFSDTGAV
jgi:hypothetical protein